MSRVKKGLDAYMMNHLKISTYSYIRKKWGKEKYIQDLLERKTKPDGFEYNPPSK